MLPKVCAFIILTVLLLILSACTQPLPAQRISGTYSDTSEVAIAIDAAGRSHTLTTECATRGELTCFLAYRNHIGYVTSDAIRIDTSAGTIQRYPDITLDNEGGVYLAWQVCPTSYTGCVDYYAFGSRQGFPVIARLDASRNSSGRPILASRGPYVYVVYEVPDGTGSALRYRQLHPLDHSGGWVSGHSTNGTRHQFPSLAIRADGTLHVAWQTNDAGTDYIRANYNSDLLGDMGNSRAVYSGDVSAPEIAISADDNLEIISWVDYAATPDPSSASLWVATCNISIGTCSTASAFQGQFDLPAAKDWVVLGNPAMTAGSTNVSIAFSAKNADTGAGYEIFYLGWTPGTPLGAPTQLSFNGLRNDQPFLEIVNSYAVALWRVDEISPLQGDIFMWHMGETEPIVIRKADNWNGRDGADLASNGSRIAGVWLENNPDPDDNQDEAWLMFDGYAVYIPLVVK